MATLNSGFCRDPETGLYDCKIRPFNLGPPLQAVIGCAFHFSETDPETQKGLPDFLFPLHSSIGEPKWLADRRASCLTLNQGAL